MAISQKNRPIRVSTVLGEDVLLFYQMHGTEKLGELFEYERKRSLPLPFPGNAAILAAISAGETPALPGGGERLRTNWNC
ncbi:MAG: hypothetical protein NTX45_27275 [Proteobacteria bacterium]|nr:hypothetical protein [Pseudomonadota bacterium]